MYIYIYIYIHIHIHTYMCMTSLGGPLGSSFPPAVSGAEGCSNCHNATGQTEIPVSYTLSYELSPAYDSDLLVYLMFIVYMYTPLILVILTGLVSSVLTKSKSYKILTKSKSYKILFGGDLWPTQLRLSFKHVAVTMLTDILQSCRLTYFGPNFLGHCLCLGRFRTADMRS